jgi:hypothetical protein
MCTSLQERPYDCSMPILRGNIHLSSETKKKKKKRKEKKKKEKEPAKQMKRGK